MSTEQLHIRLSEGERRRLDLIAEAMGRSRAGAIRFLIRQWAEQRKDYHTDTQVVSQATRL